MATIQTLDIGEDWCKLEADINEFIVMSRRYLTKDMIGIDISDRHLSFAIEYCKDFNARRAAVVTGYESDSGYNLAKREDVIHCVGIIVGSRLEASHIDAEWVLMEAVDNHLLARQDNNISASNTALGLIAKHTMVDALASDKLNLNVVGDREVMQRLMRARKRMQPPAESDEPDDDVSFF
tara:strand:+ start:1220 stop:1762 length:543 start_codon:yes stop_codon:yes gene_type:complete